MGGGSLQRVLRPLPSGVVACCRGQAPSGGRSQAPAPAIPPPPSSASLSRSLALCLSFSLSLLTWRRAIRPRALADQRYMETSHPCVEHRRERTPSGESPDTVRCWQRSTSAVGRRRWQRTPPLPPRLGLLRQRAWPVATGASPPPPGAAPLFLASPPAWFGPCPPLFSPLPAVPPSPSTRRACLPVTVDGVLQETLPVCPHIWLS